MALSDKLYKMVNIEEDRLTVHNHQCFSWAWHWIYMNQPAKTIKAELKTIEQLVNDNSFEPNELLEFAWKAESLEKLL